MSNPAEHLSVAEQLSTSITSVHDAVFDMTGLVYGQEAVLEELDATAIEHETVYGLSDEEYAAYVETAVSIEDLDKMTPEEFAAHSAKLAATNKRSPHDFRCRVLSKAGLVFGPLNDYAIDLLWSSAAEIRFDPVQSPFATAYQDGDDNSHMEHRWKSLFLDGDETRIVTTERQVMNGATQEERKLPPEEGDDTLPQETLQRLGRVSIFVDGLAQFIAQNDNNPPEGLYERGFLSW